MSSEGGQIDAQKAMQEQQKKQQQEEAMKAMLLSILSEEARARLARIRLVKPDKARAIEQHLVMGARKGQVQTPVPENTVVAMLERMSKQEAKPSIKFQRKTMFEDDEEDNDDDLE